jgi:hypothetical protein
MTNIDNFPTNLSPKEVLEKFYKQPLEFKVSKPQTKRWENVKPKGIIQALKEEACDPNVNNHGLHYTKYSKDEDGYFRK